MSATFRPSEWFGRAPPRDRVVDRVLPALAVFGAGLLVGVGAALVLAPKPGRELRQDVARTVNQLGETVREQFSHHEPEPAGQAA